MKAAEKIRKDLKELEKREIKLQSDFDEYRRRIDLEEVCNSKMTETGEKEEGEIHDISIDSESFRAELQASPDNLNSTLVSRESIRGDENDKENGGLSTRSSREPR